MTKTSSSAVAASGYHPLRLPLDWVLGEAVQSGGEAGSAGELNHGGSALLGTASDAGEPGTHWVVTRLTHAVQNILSLRNTTKQRW